jgi:hypothetical protein
MSAQYIFDTAPLGALIRFSDGTPKPPIRFTKKLAAWENNNAVGRLTAKSAASQMGSHMMPAAFALHMGDYGSNGVIILTVTRTFTVITRLAFEILDCPQPGMVLVLQRYGERTEMLHLAASHQAAQSWLGEHGYRDAWLEEVVGDAPFDTPEIGRAAA